MLSIPYALDTLLPEIDRGAHRWNLTDSTSLDPFKEDTVTTALLDRPARIDDPIEATTRRGFLGGAGSSAEPNLEAILRLTLTPSS